MVDDALGSSEFDQCIFLNYYKAKRRNLQGMASLKGYQSDRRFP